MPPTSARLSFPKEHGALITLSAALLCGLALSRAPGPAALVVVALAAAFVLRGPLDQLAARATTRPLDRPLAAFLPLVAAAALVALGRLWELERALVALPLVLGIPLASALARRARAQRRLLIELGGLGILGASSGLVALAGEAGTGPSIALGLGLGSYGAAMAPLVRAQTKKATAGQARILSAVAAAILAVGAGAVALHDPVVAIALVPRWLHAVINAVHGATKRKIGFLAAREAVELVAFCALLVVLLRWPGLLG